MGSAEAQPTSDKAFFFGTLQPGRRGANSVCGGPSTPGGGLYREGNSLFNKIVQGIRPRIAVGVAASLFLFASTANAEEEPIRDEAGMGAASAAASLIYGPAKLIYAGGGGLVAGMAYVVSGGDKQVAKPILDASMRGTYVLTPEHLSGDRPIEFVGRDPEARELRDQSEAWENVNSETADTPTAYQSEDEEYGPWQSPEDEGKDSAWVQPQ